MSPDKIPSELHILRHIRLKYGKNETHYFEILGAVLLKRQNNSLFFMFFVFILTSSVLSPNPTNLLVQTINPIITYQIHQI